MTKPPQLTALALALVLALAGCGGSDDDDGGGGGDKKPASERSAEAAPEPKEAIDATAERFAAAIESGDCKELGVNGVHSTKRPPEVEKTNKPPTKQECGALTRFAKQFEGYEPGASKTFGSAAIVDAEVKGKPVTSTFVLDVDGTWKHTTSTLPGSDHQVGTEAPAGNAFDAGVNEFVKALQDRDCKEVFRLMSPESEVLQPPRNREATFCKQVAPAFDQDDTFIGRAAADPDAKPVPLGKTLDLAFYGLALDGGRYYYTLAMHRALQTVPGAKDHERDSVMNWYLAKE